MKTCSIFQKRIKEKKQESAKIPVFRFFLLDFERKMQHFSDRVRKINEYLMNQVVAQIKSLAREKNEIRLVRQVAAQFMFKSRL